MRATPEAFAQQSPWPLSEWRIAYATAGHLPEWPRIAVAFLGSDLPPSELVKLIDLGHDYDAQIEALSRTSWGRWRQLGAALRRLGQAYAKVWPFRLLARTR